MQPATPLVELGSDAAQIEKLLRTESTNGGLWFSDSDCAAKFATPGPLVPAMFRAFAKCVATLNLQTSARGDALGDVQVYSYAPGFEVEARIMEENDGPRLAWIGFASRAQPVDPPTVTSDVLEALRASGEPNGPLAPELAAQLTLDPAPKSHAEYAWLRVCIDETGKVRNVTSYESTSPAAHKAFVTAALTWSFNPFLLGGQPMPVCAMLRPAYPAGGGPVDEKLPLPLPPVMRNGKAPIVIAQAAKLIEGKRISGEKMVVPDDDTKNEIQERHISRVTGQFRLCVTESGKVESVLPVVSTGIAEYDRTIIGAIQKWVYSPYKVGDQAVPICTAVTFIYTQK